MKKILIPIIALIGFGFNAFAQVKSIRELSSTNEPALDKPKNELKSEEAVVQKKTTKEVKGDKKAFSYSFDKAIKSYSHTKNLSVEGQRNLAESYHKIGQDTLAEKVYSGLMSTQGVILPEDYYNYAMVLKSNGKYDQSALWMDKFNELKPNDLRAKSYVADNNELNNLLKDDSKYKIEHLSLNTDAEDFAPSYYKEKIVFASTRQAPKMFKRKYNWNGKPFLNMYVSDVENGQLKNPAVFDKHFNGKMHDGPASFSKDGTFMAFTRNNYDVKRKDKIVNLQIYFSNFKDGKWSKAESFVLNNKDYSVGHPCLSADGKTMYFTSDMPGGFGGADIYRIKKSETGSWSAPENLGNKINTEGDEMFPFYEENNKVLFFASNGRFGLGGLDIFICPIDSLGIGQAYNAGYPLNTQYDDFAVIVDDKIGKGYFSSNRIGGSGDDDIYSVDFLKAADLQVQFSVMAPKNVPIERRVREIFPLRNYIFFKAGSTEMPDRYVLLNKEQVSSFKEDQLESFVPKNLSGRSGRQMTVYYNVLNILGDRMQKNPLATIKLVGSSEKGPEDGKLMSESVKKYLVNVFGISASRIGVEGRKKPKLPSEQPNGKLELVLLREGDQRVSIESSSSALLMEFMSGPNAPLKPVEILTTQSPINSYVSFQAKGAKEAYTSWAMDIADENGKIQHFGPMTQDSISIPGESILGTRPEGDFKVTMIGQTISGKTEMKDTSVHIVLWIPSKEEAILRFSIIYEFNDSKAIAIYEKYLTDIVLPKIPKGASVIIHGYTDIIGPEAYNLKLSLARANDALKIMKNGLAKAHRNDVKFAVYGFGEDEKLAQFENKFPEERFYNRAVMIDIVPLKPMLSAITK